ncbi:MULTISPECIES: septal ring lytic transglycosylase RlpA family protein [Pandoraea]|uniref:Endolytic peptidoglycan transglycosylase RlpA n=1 Tax=Pandoraea nosoerga TaxID=2508296 RepID=A0A5E4UL99_9BURK|nr:MULTISPECIES: septal ring lytic transglycosylase RlpA family protein [Pandoraea]VVE00682.1 Endolytic peptidoglycan transglycosylase RlpA [Pandoraea nosoerga]
MLTRFAVGCALALTLTACTTPLEPPSQSAAAPSATGAGTRAREANAPVGSSFDLHWPGRVYHNGGLNPGDPDAPERDGEARLRADAGTFFQTGTASWYGKKFHGRRTATGETFDMNELTAAHPTLPLASFVLVRNVANNKAVVVKINDRGPYTRKRIIDLSYGAAKKLDFVNAGHAKVEIRRLSRSEIAALGLEDGGNRNSSGNGAARASSSPTEASAPSADAIAPRPTPEAS